MQWIQGGMLHAQSRWFKLSVDLSASGPLADIVLAENALVGRTASQEQQTSQGQISLPDWQQKSP
jgi:hypothetical protein